MAFTEFYLQSGGSNLNSGSTNANAATYSSAGGNWVNATSVFTPTDGVNPSLSVNVGDFGSIYVTAGATATGYIARVTAVQNAVNGTITFDNTGSFVYGSKPANGTGTITVKVGGAWVGPGAAVIFPFGLSGSIASLTNTSVNHVRINAKNDQTYTLTSALPFTTLNNSIMQGYTTSVGDLGKATFTSNITSGSNFSNTLSNATFIDIVFVNTGGSGSNNLFDTAGTGSFFLRCVFHGARGSGLNNSSGAVVSAIECEAYDCNKNNSAGFAGFSNRTSNGIMLCVNCYSHDHTSGSNADNFSSSNSGGGFILLNSTAESSAGIGLNAINPSVHQLIAINNNFYNNTGDAIKMSPTNQVGFSFFMNNNFLKNGGKAIDNTNATQAGILYNNGRGSGTQANGSGDALGSIVDTGTDVTFASNVTPWNAPTTGDFSTTLAAAQGVGRGAFTETDGSNTGTVGYPDIGAAQANAITQAPSWAGGDFVIPTGYIGHAYLYEWAFSSNATFALQSGSLPPGLTITPVSTNGAEIVGTPTTIGTYNFVLRVTVGTSTGDATFHITVNADPDEGIGGLLGGLRPTC